ncbi:MAG TPA: molybdopterin cofactor-binding domain-containing protein [Pseudolabrys sp.]|nr:molybdopterin cofactor-binding domain-containing protein [Pseudolabrys sp.]
MNAPLTTPTRRMFVATGGALVVSFALAPHGALAQAAKPNVPAQPKLPGSLGKAPVLDAWIGIGGNGGITVFTGKAELGQGIMTALIQCAAEELDVDPAAIALVTADTERTANEGYTAGSHSMQDSGTAILNAAAQVRAILIELAATRLNLTANQLHAKGGAIVADDGRSLAYKDLVLGQELHRAAQPQSPLKDPKSYTVIGKPMRRVDIPGKVTGAPMYVQDLRPEGMLHARVVRPPNYGAELVSVDIATVEKLPGVIKVVRDGSFIAVAAQGEFQAIEAMNMLASIAQWRKVASLPDEATIHQFLTRLPAQDEVIANKGSPAQQGTHVVNAAYTRPYLAHGSIGPSCAVALYKANKLTVWTHSQGVFPLRASLANMLQLRPEQVHCIHVEGSGCYGHNAADDAAADAALIARAIPGRPIRVQWMREQEHGWEPFGPAMASSVSGAIDGSGRIVSWNYAVWSNTHSTRPGGPAGNLLAAQYLARPFQPPAPKEIPLPDGGGDRNAIPLYTIPNEHVVDHFIPQMPLRVSALRGLGAYHNVFSVESFMDELALAAKADPVEFRLKHLDDPRARDVITKAAQEFGWKKGETRPRGQGRGFAFARYKNSAAYCALAVDVTVERETGEVHLGRIVAAIDSGQAVNPDGIRNQIEGAIVQSASWTLYETVTFDRTDITSRDWSSYPILRFPQAPESVTVHIIDRPGEPFLGTGEAGQGPTAAAIANAIADATGARLRDLPLTADRIKQAIGV